MKKAISFAAALAFLCSAASAQTWIPVASGISDVIYHSHFLNADTGWFCGGGGIIRKTTNGGSTWSAQSGSHNLTTIRFINANTGWSVGGAVGTGIILKTTNGGTNWITQKSDISVMWGLTMVDASTGWATGAYGSILKTTNGGTNWIEQTSGTYEDFRRNSFVDNNNGWVVGLSGGIYRTTNGGATWAPQTSGVTGILVDVQFLDAQNGWVAGHGGTILKTTNGGVAWVKQTSGVTTDLNAVFFTSLNTGYAAGSAGLILKTSDGGATWTPQPAVTSANLVSINFVNGTRGWITGDNSALLKTALPAAPANFAYSPSSVTYTVGTTITPNVPSVTGTTPLFFEASTNLPDGLTLNPATGRISGTPLTPSSPILYTITATNDHGSTTANVLIGVTGSSAISSSPAAGTRFDLALGMASLAFAAPYAAASARIEILTARGHRVHEETRALAAAPALKANALTPGIYTVRVTWLDEKRNAVGTAARTFAQLKP